MASFIPSSDDSLMREFLIAALWIYFGWYASSLAAEYASIPGFAGAIVVIAVITGRRVGRARLGAPPVGHGRTESRA